MRTRLFSLFLDMMFSIFNIAVTMAKEILWILLNYGYLGIIHSTDSTLTTTPEPQEITATCLLIFPCE